MRRVAGLVGIVLALACSREQKDEGATTPAAEATAVAPPAAATPTQAPPDLGFAQQDYAEARILQACARRFGESEADALVLAVDRLQGRDHRAPADPAPKSAEAGPAGADTPVPPPAALTPTTPAGRPALGDDGKLIARRFEAAHAQAAGWKPLQKRIDEAVAGCHYDATIGLITDAQIASYIEVFVTLACLQDRARRDKRVDVTAAAVATFRTNHITARGFAIMGLALAAFADVQKQAHDARRDACPDPRAAVLKKLASGRFAGTFSGTQAGTLTIVADDGPLRGEIIFAASKKTAAQPKTAQPKTGAKAEDTAAAADQRLRWQASGAISGERINFFARNEMDWVRFEGAVTASGSKGKWSGEIGFRKARGVWQIAPPPPPPPPAPVPAAPAPAP